MGLKPIPDTSIFDLRASRRGVRLNHAGLNIYFMLKLGSVTGNSLYKMGAQMRGESYEQFLSTRSFKDAV